MHAALLLTALAVALNPDPAHTTVQFKLGATLHTVHGSFKLAHSDVRFDPASGKISGVVAIDASSGGATRYAIGSPGARPNKDRERV